MRKQDTGRPRSVRTPEFEEAVLTEFQDQPSTSTRQVAHNLGVDHSVVWRVLHEQLLHPYHLQKVQHLKVEDYPRRVQFCQWYLQRCIIQPQFPNMVLFSDECTFTREGILNMHNAHLWADENPKEKVVRSYQERFQVNIWAGIIGDNLIGPYMLPLHLNGARYHTFLVEVLPQLLEEVPLWIRNGMWLQHDGAPAHFDANVRRHLDITYPGRWVGRGGPVPWPPRSPDLNPLDYFLWGDMKQSVYQTPVESQMDLIARIHAAAEIIQTRPRALERVRQSLHRRCTLCNEMGGGYFENLL